MAISAPRSETEEKAVMIVEQRLNGVPLRQLASELSLCQSRIVQLRGLGLRVLAREQRQAETPEWRALSVRDVPQIPFRARNAFIEHGIYTLSDLVVAFHDLKQVKAMVRWPNMGKRSVETTREWLHGFLLEQGEPVLPASD